MTDDTVVGDLYELDLFEAQRIPQDKRPFMKKQKGAWNLLQGAVFRGFWIDPKEATLESWGLEEGDENAFLAMAVQESENVPKPKSECCRWLDIDGSDGDKDEAWIEKLNLGHLARDELCKPVAKWNSHVVGMRSKVLLKIRILPAGTLEGEAENDSIAEHSNPDQYLAAIISKKLLVTWSTFEGVPNQKYRSLSQQLFAFLTMDDDESPLHDASTSSALIAWMDFHFARTSQHMLDLRHASGNVMKQLDDDPSIVNVSEIMDFKTKLLLALAVAEEQALCVNMMKKLDKDKDVSAGPDFSKLKGSLSCLIAAADATERMGLRLEKRSIYLRQQYESHQQDNINNRLAILTVLSAIFMPLTLNAGIYGMNFEYIPELQYENGYFIFLGFQASIAVVMLVFFYYQGWFV